MIGRGATYDWIFMFFIMWRKLCDSFLLQRVVLVHSWVISFILAFFEPDGDFSELPGSCLFWTRIKRDKFDLILAVNKIKLLRKVCFSNKFFDIFVPNCIRVDLKLFIHQRVNFFESQINLVGLAKYVLLGIADLGIDYKVHTGIITAEFAVERYRVRISPQQMFTCFKIIRGRLWQGHFVWEVN